MQNKRRRSNLAKKKRRVYRGLFISKSGKSINADVNGAYQIMKKVVPDAFSEGIEGVGLHPVRYYISQRQEICQ